MYCNLFFNHECGQEKHKPAAPVDDWRLPNVSVHRVGQANDQQ